MRAQDILKDLRQKHNMTQDQLAEKLSVTRQAVSRWETGETTPGIDMVKLICVTFGVPLERFFDMPMNYYCQCCSMPIPDEEMHGTEADGYINYVKGANVAGFMKVAKAMMAQGIV